jgi:hypothetical protein
MKTTAVLLLLTMFLPPSAVAGGIYGRISDAKNSPIKTVPIEVVAADNKPYKTQTRADGTYSLYVPSRGTCQFVVTYRGQHPSAAVYSFDSSARYDFVLTLKDGQYELSRQ